jgi:glyoxylase-like metal-dependent hydrolase (beta-lactamase superfamily II)
MTLAGVESGNGIIGLASFGHTTGPGRGRCERTRSHATSAARKPACRQWRFVVECSKSFALEKANKRQSSAARPATQVASANSAALLELGEGNNMKKLVLAAILACCLSAIAMAQDARTVIENAQVALGNVQSITYSGSARYVNFQQCGANATAMICYGTHDPMRPITSYVRVIDLAAPTSRHTGGTMNIGPGGSTTVTPGTFFEQVTPQQADVSQAWGQSLELYITPWGFLKGAAENDATASRDSLDGRDYTVLSWSPAVRAPSGRPYTINAYVNGDNLIERVETWLGENIMGDMHIVATYANWRSFDGAMAPTRIVQTRGGWPFFEVDVTHATGNPPEVASLAPAPGAPQGGPGAGGGQPPQFDITKEQLGEGLFRYTTGAGSYDSLIVEFNDHIMMLEAGQSQARAQAYVDEIKRQFPGKPIRYVFNTHAHNDHTPGLPVLVAEGATIITHANNREFLEGALNTPRTLLDDALARNPRPAMIDGVEDKRVYTDGNRTVEFYHIFPAPHSDGLLVAYFPQEKILFQGDFSVNPGQPANDHVRALVAAVEKLGIDFERYINVHVSAAPQTREDVYAALGM